MFIKFVFYPDGGGVDKKEHPRNGGETIHKPRLGDGFAYSSATRGVAETLMGFPCVGFAHPQAVTQKRTPPKRGCSFLWRGLGDSNPRPTGS